MLLVPDLKEEEGEEPNHTNFRDLDLLVKPVVVWWMFLPVNIKIIG